MEDADCMDQQPLKTPRVSRQFWQAGDLLPETDAAAAQRNEQPGLDHARLHPRFLHSNATSHKWALGALVELLDNSMDEVTAGCTYVSVDKVNHPMDGAKNPMLLVEDNGGGMDTTTIRNCMSFGFSLKHGKKMIGQYGNGFKTSTMRLGADALVLTKSASARTCSIGLLSYTFLTETNSQDVVVPIVDYNLQERTRQTRGDETEWVSKLDMICNWGPFGSEAEIWQQLDCMPEQGTRVYIWNLWQTSDNLPELDFITDVYDVRLRGHEEDVTEASGRKKKSDEGMKRCHSYRHSLRSYVSMLYLQWPDDFQIVVRGKEVMPVPVTAGMKHVAVYEYRPRSLPKDESGSGETRGPVVVPVYIGFAVEAPDTSVSGFCVYHRNRLIKPFWKVYTSASSVGRGVIGFLQVDFVEPAHDKQDFENTPPLQKLEKYLKRQVPLYWRTKSHLVGYQDHVPSSKPEAAPANDDTQIVKGDKGAASMMPVNNGNLEETAVTMAVETCQAPSAKNQSTATRRIDVGYPSSCEVRSEEGKVRGPHKTPSKCLHEMQHHISQLQLSVQEFCNSYEIKEAAQSVLGQIFGSTMSNLMGPARDLKRMCAVQVKGHRQALLFIAKSKTEGNLAGPIPQFIQAEMKAMGLDLVDSMLVEETGEESTHPDIQTVSNGQQLLQFDLMETQEMDGTLSMKRKAAGTDTPDTVDDSLPEGTAQMGLHSYPQDVIGVSAPQWIQQPSVDQGVGMASSQDLRTIGLSVVEKFFKTKPPKLGVVQLAPNSHEAHQRGFVSGSNDPLEVVNLSDELAQSGASSQPKRQRREDNSSDGCKEGSAEDPASMDVDRDE